MGKVVFPFDSYVSPLYDSSVKKVDEYILMVELQDVPYKVCREVSVPSNLYIGYLGEVLVIADGGFMMIWAICFTRWWGGIHNTSEAICTF